MTPIEAIDIGRDALWVLIKITTPIMAVALSVGLVISLIQALTQIQEMTLSFVPKIIAIFFAVMIFLPYIERELSDFATRLAERIATPTQQEGPVSP